MTVYINNKELRAKSAFIIAPIGSERTDIRRRIDGHLELIYRPVLKELGYIKILASHEESKPGSITQQIIGHLFNDDMVIADLTTLNANVMYELSVRHAVQKPVVTVAAEGTIFPFDIKDDRHLTFRNDEMGLVELKSKLPAVIKEAEKDKKPDNPISRYSRYKAVMEVPDTSEKNIQKFIFEELNQIKNIIIRNNSKNINLTSEVGSGILISEPLNTTILEAKPLYEIIFEDDENKINEIRKALKIEQFDVVELENTKNKKVKKKYYVEADDNLSTDYKTLREKLELLARIHGFKVKSS
ncbi:MAG: hypothetical protein JW944_07885 [Deltaproteobacteria bacterium]|nr:hypothetical protein [Deltaproteobacteria bacterium]